MNRPTPSSSKYYHKEYPSNSWKWKLLDKTEEKDETYFTEGKTSQQFLVQME